LAKAEVKSETVKKPKDEDEHKECTFEVLDDKGHDVGRSYRGAPAACAKRYWRRMLCPAPRGFGKKLDVVRLRERSRLGKTRRLHVYKLTGEKEVEISKAETVPEYRRGKKYIDPIFEKKPIEHVQTLDVRAPYLKGRKPKEAKPKEVAAKKVVTLKE
jgi:hypothetical protein